jgi:hypothetical protein
MKKTFLLLLGIAGLSLAANAQTDAIIINQPLADGPVIVAGAQPIQRPIVYTQPVQYTAPVVYNQPVVYNAPVDYAAPPVYNAPVIENFAPADFAPSDPAAVAPCQPVQPVICQPGCQSDTSSVQVIHFGRGQANGQGYYFRASR